MTDQSTQHQVVQLVEADIPAALELCRSNGWNQTRSDWLRLIRYEPHGCFASHYDNELAGTVTTTRYGALGWIGMMLVRDTMRRRGLATALMLRSIEYLRQQSVACIKLDATPAGRKVYRRLGFEDEWTFQRWHRPGEPSSTDNGIDANSSELQEFHFQIDQRAFGVDRRQYLSLLAADSLVVQEEHGFALLRAGNRAAYLGPVCSHDEKQAATMVRRMSDLVSGDLFWDVPSPNPDAMKLASELGFQPVRDLVRMRLGSDVQSCRWQMQFAIGGPATG